MNSSVPWNGLVFFSEHTARNSRSTRVHAAAVLSSLLLFALPLPTQVASAAQYRFTTIADSSDVRLATIEFNGTPAVNNDGVVIFGATVVEGGEAIFAGNGGQLTTVVDTKGQFNHLYFEELSINSAGAVAFIAATAAGSGGVFAVQGETTTTIVDSTGPLNEFKGVSINDSGSVAFYGRGAESSGIYVGQGGSLTTIVEHRETSPPDIPDPAWSEPSINKHGDVAFFGYLESTETNGIFVGNGDSLVQIVEATQPYNRLRPERRSPINDAGQVAFAADGFDTTLGLPARGVFRYDQGTVLRIVSLARPTTHDLSDVMINEAGTIVFGGRYSPLDPLSGIFTGPNPDTDKVIAYGDLLDGSPVTNLRFWGQGLNDRGQVAFFASTETATGIYLATPIPEPRTELLLLAGLLYYFLRDAKEA